MLVVMVVVEFTTSYFFGILLNVSKEDLGLCYLHESLY